MQDIQPSTRLRINISQVPAGKLCISVFICFLFFSKLFMCFNCFYVFFDCKCKSLNRLGKNIYKKKTHRKRHKSNRKASRKKNINTQKYRISSPRTSAKLCISVVFMFFFSKLFCFISVSFCVLCFRLIYSSFCMFNRKNTYNNRTTNIKSFEKKHKHKQKTEIHDFPAGT